MIIKIGSKLALIVFLAGCTQKKVEQPMDVSDEVGFNGMRVDSKHSRSEQRRSDAPRVPVKKQVKPVWKKKSDPKPVIAPKPLVASQPINAVITTKIDGPVTSTTMVKHGIVSTTIEGSSPSPISQQTVSVESHPTNPVQVTQPEPVQPPVAPPQPTIQPTQPTQTVEPITQVDTTTVTVPAAVQTAAITA
jgi:hypothetical protein